MKSPLKFRISDIARLSKTKQWVGFILNMLNKLTYEKKCEVMAILTKSHATSSGLIEVKKTPQLENENYKIDQYTTLEAKLHLGWEKEVDFNGIVFLKKDLWNGAYVIEYLEWVDKEYIWEQKFNIHAIDKLWLRSKCMRDNDEVEIILGNLSKYDLKKQHKLSGRYELKENTIEDIGIRNNYRLEDWSVVWISENFEIIYSKWDSKTAHSVRLVKGR